MTDSSRAQTRPPSARQHWRLAALLATLTMIGPFAIDGYLPAFPTMRAEFGVAPIAIQQTLSAYLLAFAFMLLWHGALADAFGRRAVVLVAMTIFAIATLACAIAGNIESLWLARALQGLCAGAPMVAGRAIIRDRFHGADAQRLMSQVTLIFGIAPAIAPVIGGVLLEASGWRAIFWFVFAFTLVALAWSWQSLPETLPPEARQPLHPRVQFANYRHVIAKPDFLLLAMIPALNFSGFFLYVAAAPAFLVDLLGVSTTGFAWLFVPMIGGVMLGALLSGRVAGRLTPRQTVRLGYRFLFAGAALQLAAAYLAPAQVAWHVLPIAVYSMGSAAVMPSATLLLLDLFPANRGLASSLQGFLQFSLSALTAGTIAPFLSHTLPALALGTATFATASSVLWITYQRRLPAGHAA
jgi:DHA1 family bicyclomycin/chloramphenicol resistance-like MFS transporter